MDIGSNDGIFLEPLKNLGIKAIGVEPAKNVAKVANSKGLLLLYQNISMIKLSLKLKNDFGKVDVVTAFNVFAHGDKLRNFRKYSRSFRKMGSLYLRFNIY